MVELVEASPIEDFIVCVVLPERVIVPVFEELVGAFGSRSSMSIEPFIPSTLPKIFKFFALLIVILPESRISILVNDVLLLLIVRVFVLAIEIFPVLIVSPLRFKPTLPIFTFHELLILRLSLISALIKFKFPEPLISELFPLFISLVTLTPLVNTAPIS